MNASWGVEGGVAVQRETLGNQTNRRTCCACNKGAFLRDFLALPVRLTSQYATPIGSGRIEARTLGWGEVGCCRGGQYILKLCYNSLQLYAPLRGDRLKRDRNVEESQPQSQLKSH